MVSPKPSARQWKPPSGAASASPLTKRNRSSPKPRRRSATRSAITRSPRSSTAISARDDKERIVELLWQVAYVDATLSAHEQHVIRKVADLLHLSHASYVGAKLRAKDAADRK